MAEKAVRAQLTWLCNISAAPVLPSVATGGSTSTYRVEVVPTTPTSPITVAPGLRDAGRQEACSRQAMESLARLHWQTRTITAELLPSCMQGTARGSDSRLHLNSHCGRHERDAGGHLRPKTCRVLGKHREPVLHARHVSGECEHALQVAAKGEISCPEGEPWERAAGGAHPTQHCLLCVDRQISCAACCPCALPRNSRSLCRVQGYPCQKLQGGWWSGELQHLGKPPHGRL